MPSDCEIFSFARAAGRGEDLRAHVPGDLDRRQADAAGRGMDQHALAGLHLGQAAQGKFGRHEADGDGRPFFEAEMGRLQGDKLGHRNDVRGKAGRGQRRRLRRPA